MSTRRVVDGVPVGPHPNVDRLRQVLNVGLNANLAGNTFPKAVTRTGASASVRSDADDEQQLTNLRDAYGQVQVVIDHMKGLMKGMTGDKEKLEKLKKKTAEVMDVLKNPGSRHTLEDCTEQNRQIEELQETISNLRKQCESPDVAKFTLLLEGPQQKRFVEILGILKESAPGSMLEYFMRQMFEGQSDSTGKLGIKLERIITVAETAANTHMKAVADLDPEKRKALKEMGLTLEQLLKSQLGDGSLTMKEAKSTAIYYANQSPTPKDIEDLRRMELYKSIRVDPDTEDSDKEPDSPVSSMTPVSNSQDSSQNPEASGTKDMSTKMTTVKVFNALGLAVISLVTVSLLIYFVLRLFPEFASSSSTLKFVQGGTEKAVEKAAEVAQGGGQLAGDAVDKVKEAAGPLLDMASKGGAQLAETIYGGVEGAGDIILKLLPGRKLTAEQIAVIEQAKRSEQRWWAVLSFLLG